SSPSAAFRSITVITVSSVSRTAAVPAALFYEETGGRDARVPLSSDLVERPDRAAHLVEEFRRVDLGAQGAGIDEDDLARDRLEAAFDEALQKCRRIAITAAARIVGVIGNNKRLVVRLAGFRFRDGLRDGLQLKALVIARLPAVIHAFLANRLPARDRARPGGVDRHRHRRPNIPGIRAA